MLIHQDQCVLFYAEVAVRRCSVKKVFLKLSRNSQESICVGVSFSITLQACFIKKRLRNRCFPVNFAKFLRTPFYIEHLRWLLLQMENFSIDFLCKCTGFYMMGALALNDLKGFEKRRWPLKKIRYQ